MISSNYDHAAIERELRAEAKDPRFPLYRCAFDCRFDEWWIVSSPTDFDHFAAGVCMNEIMESNAR